MYNNYDLSVLAYANNFTLWHYKTEDSSIDLIDGYFNDAGDMLRKNDMILVSTKNKSSICIVSQERNIVDDEDLIIINMVSDTNTTEQMDEDYNFKINNLESQLEKLKEQLLTIQEDLS